VSPDFLAVVAPHAIENLASGSALVLGVALVLGAVCLGMGRYCERIRRELMNISRALTAAPARGQPGNIRKDKPTLIADAPTAVLWVNGFDALGMQSILAIGQTFQDAFSQIVLASVHAFDMTDAERAHEADQLRSSLENSLTGYTQIAALFGMSVGSKVALGPNVRILADQVADDLVRTYPRVIFFVPELAIAPARWYHQLLDSPVAPSFVRRLKLLGVVTHEILLPVGVGPAAEGVVQDCVAFSPEIA
jgi:hypothetical protein